MTNNNPAVPRFDARTVLRITLGLERECLLYEQYVALTASERSSVVEFNPEKVETLILQRDELLEKISEARDSRDEMIRQAIGSDTVPKLSDLIRERCSPEDRRKLLPLTDKLRALVQKSRGVSIEFSQVLNFSLNIVSSAISVIWSGTQEVQRAYTSNGVVREKFHSAAGQTGALLTSA